jgi:hypothetical protein
MKAVSGQGVLSGCCANGSAGLSKLIADCMREEKEDDGNFTDDRY